MRISIQSWLFRNYYLNDDWVFVCYGLVFKYFQPHLDNF